MNRFVFLAKTQQPWRQRKQTSLSAEETTYSIKQNTPPSWAMFPVADTPAWKSACPPVILIAPPQLLYMRHPAVLSQAAPVRCRGGADHHHYITRADTERAAFSSCTAPKSKWVQEKYKWTTLKKTTINQCQTQFWSSFREYFHWKVTSTNDALNRGVCVT